MSKNTNELKTRALGRFGLEVSTLGSPAEVGLQRAAETASDGPGSRISAKREATYCQDRMAPDSTIRHPVLCQNSAQPALTKELRLSKSG